MKVALSLVALAFGLSQAAAENDLLIVTVGEGGHRLSSRDGEVFEIHQSRQEGTNEDLDLRSVCYGNGIFVGAGGREFPRAVLTDDGSAWKEIDSALFQGLQGPASCVLFAEPHFYLMTLAGVLLRSGDGREWERIGTAPLEEGPKRQQVRELAFGNGVFVGTGDYGAMPVSRDMGKTWTVLTAPLHGSEPVGPSVVFGNGVFIITGVAGYTATSRDGMTWENETTHDGRYERVGNLTWTGREFFACAESADGSPFFRLMSRTGSIWTGYQPGRKNQPEKIWRFGGMYYGTSDESLQGRTRLFRSQNTREWERLDLPKKSSVRWMACNLPVPDKATALVSKFKFSW